MNKFFTTITSLVIIFSSFEVFSQGAPACPDVYAGNDTSVCIGSPVTINATTVSSNTTSTYSVAAIPNVAYPYTGGTAVSVNTDDVWSGIITLPFNFCYFGTSYNKCVLGSNGQLCFKTSNANGSNGWEITTPLPSTTDMPGNTICAVFRDIDPALGGQMKYYVTGASPCRALVVYWNNVPLFDNGGGTCDGTPNSTFQLVLYESTNFIDVYVDNSYSCSEWNGGYGIIGIQNATATVAVCPPSRNEPSTWTTTGEAWRFTPTGPPAYSFNWYNVASPGVSLGTTLSLPVTPSATTSYYGEMILTNCDGTSLTRRDTLTVNVTPNTVVANAGPDEILMCGNTATVNLDGTASETGDTYSWTGPGTITNGTTETPTVNANGSYIITVTNPISGCIARDTAKVNLPASAPVADAGADLSLTCTSPTVNLDGTGSASSGVNYTWTGPGTITNGTTETPTVNTAGTYTITVTDPITSCSSTDQVAVTLNNTPPTASAGGDKTLTCTTTTLNLDGTGSTSGDTYSWTGPGTITNGTTETPTVNTAGTYTITVTGSNGCTATDQVDVTTDNSAPLASAGIDKLLTCSILTVNLDGTGSVSGDTYSWTGPGIITNATTETPTVNTIGVYTITVTGSNGCSSTDQVTVTNNDVYPVASAGGDQTLTCTTTSLNLDGTGSSLSDNYSWSGPGTITGGTTETPTINSVGIYVISVTDPTNGCVSRDTVNVNLNNTPPNITSTGSTICIGDSVALFGAGGLAYTWNNGITDGVYFKPTSDSTSYTVTGTGANGCTNTYTVSVIANAYPDVSVSATPLSGHPPLEVQFTNSSTGANNFTWNFGDGQTASDASTSGESHSYPTVGSYYIILTADYHGCKDTAMVEITVIPFAPLEYHVPNVFTPNGDGQNDYFNFGLKNAKDLNIQIVNRWGNPIINLTDIDTKGWDGKTKGGTNADEGTYFFLYQITGLDDTVVKGQGFVELQRN